jgi:hypothetical protein
VEYLQLPAGRRTNYAKNTMETHNTMYREAKPVVTLDDRSIVFSLIVHFFCFCLKVSNIENQQTKQPFVNKQTKNKDAF